MLVATTAATKKKTAKKATKKKVAKKAAKKTGGSGTLIIVESPTKAKTLKKYMGRGYDVKASVGHIIDLPKSKLGVDVEHDFAPTYVVIKGKAQVLKELKSAAKAAKRVLLATDPDREGEAIAWHISEKLKELDKDKPVSRIEFHEITKNAVQKAVEEPREIDFARFEAQQARRILDRLVGYKLSPLLWNKVRRGLSAGRVQSVALRLVVEREREIQAFESVEYWSIGVDLSHTNPPPFVAQLSKIDGKKPEIPNTERAEQLVKQLKSSKFRITSIERKERRRRPAPPFTTSTLQQEAARKLRFGAKKTMMLAQRLYEGQEVGGGESVGLITYMRTDSVRISGEAQAAARDYILGNKDYGAEYVPEKPNAYRAKKGAQEAHEAIRPTSMEYTPEKVKSYLGRDELRLYRLIWQRFLASQMTPAVYDQTGIDITPTEGEGSEELTLRVTGSVMKFPGFTKAYTEGHDEGDKVEEGDEGDKSLPDMAEGDELTLNEVLPEQHFTQPPPRFTEASLVKSLEEEGIGRPSTYAAIMANIQDKKYVNKQENRFYPTEMGTLVTDLLIEHFPTVMDIGFTARMEEELDEVAEGKREWVGALRDFYTPFNENLEKAGELMRDVRGQQIDTDIDCPKCEGKMVIKWGRFGEFLACKNYPECKGTMNFKRNEDGSVAPVDEAANAEPYPGTCDKCGGKLTLRRAWTGARYIACENYKGKCDFTKPFPIGVECPKCKGQVVERASKRKKIFYGCGEFPKCDFVAWYKPVPEKCPDCGSHYLVEKTTKKKGHHLACPEKECHYEKFLDDPEWETDKEEGAEAAS
ncbi:MAG: type I DNA topoisomerase [Chrysiogenetes bacterium]|nr:type I DNA topoisomerase [Chrysiogenetes bacterium]